MGNLSKAYNECVDAVLVLYDRMFEPHVDTFSHTEKNAIIEEVHRINCQFSELFKTFSKTITDKQKADVYFEWGKHLKQEAWFHDRFKKDNADTMQYAIDANQDAIEKMEAAYALYPTKKAREETAKFLNLYQSHAKTLMDEKSALSEQPKADTDVSDDESDVSHAAKRNKTAHSHLKNTQAFFDARFADEKRWFSPEKRGISVLTVDTRVPALVTVPPSYDSGRSLYQLKKSGVNGLPRNRGYFFDDASEKESPNADSLNATGSTPSSSSSF